MESAGREGPRGEPAGTGRGGGPLTKPAHPRQSPKPRPLASLTPVNPPSLEANPFVIGSLTHQWEHRRTFPPPLAPAFKQPDFRNCGRNSQPSLRRAGTSAATPRLEPARPRPPSQLLAGDWRRRLLLNGLSTAGFGCDEEGTSGLESLGRGFVRSLSSAGIRVSPWWQHPWPPVSFASRLSLELGLKEVRGPRDSGCGCPRAHPPPPPQIRWWWTVRRLQDSGFDFEVSARPQFLLTSDVWEAPLAPCRLRGKARDPLLGTPAVVTLAPRLAHSGCSVHVCWPSTCDAGSQSQQPQGTPCWHSTASLSPYLFVVLQVTPNGVPW